MLSFQTLLAYEWAMAGWEKIATPKFVGGISNTLNFFAGQNPFPWYKSFLMQSTLPNAKMFAYAVQYGELAVGLGLAVGAGVYLFVKNEMAKRTAMTVSILALLGGAFMNANFYLAAGWTSPAAAGTNVVMFWAAVILVSVWASVL